MKLSPSSALGAAFSLALFAAACTSDSEGGDPPAGGSSHAQGTFRFTLSPPTEFSAGVTSMSGSVYDTVQPVSNPYKDGLKSGGCTLLVSDLLSCSPVCAGGDICVRGLNGAANKCQPQASSISVGNVTVTGLEDNKGAKSFVSTPTGTTRINYQKPADSYLIFPPCAEGADVSLAAAGSAEQGAFSAATKCIAPLVVKAGEVKLENGKPLVVEWTPPAQAGSKVQVEVNITNHGSHMGKIACETADNGRLEIAANLVDALKALGVTGFPTVELTRYNKGTSAEVGVDLIVEQKVIKELTIPGFTSCTTDEDCPTGQTCETSDLICK